MKGQRVPRRRILYLTNRVPYPPDKGDRIRTFHQVEYLSRDNDVYCACFANSARERNHVLKLREWCEDVVSVPWNPFKGAAHGLIPWLRGYPMTQAVYRSPEMDRRLQAWNHKIKFDAVVAFSSMMAPYAKLVLARRRVLDLCDVDSEKWLDYARTARFPASGLWRSESRRVRREEERCLQEFDAVTLITPAERELLIDVPGSEKIEVVANGVKSTGGALHPASGRGPVVGFLGSMDYIPNVRAVAWFVRHVWPLIVANSPAARFIIIGRNPVRDVRALQQHRGVTVTGEVDDIDAYLSECRVVVAPLPIARGIPNKVLEAMAAQRPVVATSMVARTLAAEPGIDWEIDDAPQDFAQKVMTLISDQARCNTIAVNGYRFVKRHHCWDKEMSRFEEIVFGARPATAESLRAGAHFLRETSNNSRVATIAPAFARQGA
ncbi:MAG TPA: TIGR03087 family PEP-CTERM/XrtA system glycosyltransferase [Phycisphaerae bacterium]|nr:TIGR03087 family PEP-CTERM/XrtA system glycosyltransferase [Phycisphaerae bacterium]